MWEVIIAFGALDFLLQLSFMDCSCCTLGPNAHNSFWPASARAAIGIRVKRSQLASCGKSFQPEVREETAFWTSKSRAQTSQSQADTAFTAKALERFMPLPPLPLGLQLESLFKSSTHDPTFLLQRSRACNGMYHDSSSLKRLEMEFLWIQRVFI